MNKLLPFILWTIGPIAIVAFSGSGSGIHHSLSWHAHGDSSSPAPAVRKSFPQSFTAPETLNSRWNHNRQTFLNSQPAPRTGTNEYEQIENTGQYNTLPRIFVGELSNSFPSSEQDDDDGTTGTGASSSKLKLNSRIQLSLEQTHYLAKVMRLFSKKKSHESNDALIRVFDGIGGEWLCRVLPPAVPAAAGADAGTTSGQDSKKQKQRRQRNPRSRSDIPLEAECLLQLRQQKTSQSPQSPQSPWLFFAPIKKQRAKIMVEKCTELGVGVFCPILTAFTDNAAINACIGNMNANAGGTSASASASADAIMFQDMFQDMNSKAKSNNDVVAEKLSLVACEAAEQSERLSVPAFVTLSQEGKTKTQLMSVEGLLKAWTDPDPTSSMGNDRVLMVCRERTEDRSSVYPINLAMQEASALASASSSASSSSSAQCHNFAFLVGPEGGWSPEEEILFDKYCEDYQESVMGVSLGSNVLRAETASLLAVGAFSLWSSSLQV